MAFNERLKKIMDEKGLNYRSLSKLIPYTDVQIRRIALGESNPKIDFLQHLCSVFPETDLNYLVNGVKPENYELNIESVNQFGKVALTDWDSLMKNELFQAAFEKNAAIWALKQSKGF